MRKEEEEEEKRVKERKKQELKTMMKEIQEELQAKVTGQVVNMLQTFLGDVGLLLRHLLKGDQTSGQNNERTMETARMLQVLSQFDLENSESDCVSDSDTDSDSDSDSVSSEEGNTKRTDRSANQQSSNTCQCGKAVSHYQRG